MALELQNRVIEVVRKLLDADIITTPAWLVRPGKVECASEWDRIRGIYSDLTSLNLPEIMRPVERRTVDAVLVQGAETRILEVDEKQHFNTFRAATLRHYMYDVPLAFDAAAWLDRSQAKRTLERGGFAAPRPPLFPGEDGRHRQRAFRDALCDLLPPLHGFAPTLRIGDFEVKSWIFGTEAELRLADLLKNRLSPA